MRCTTALIASAALAAALLGTSSPAAVDAARHRLRRGGFEPGTEAALQPAPAEAPFERFADAFSEENDGKGFQFDELDGKHDGGANPNFKGGDDTLDLNDKTMERASARFAEVEDREPAEQGTRKYTAGSATITNSNHAKQSGKSSQRSQTTSTGSTIVGENSHHVPTVVVQNNNRHVQHA